MLFIIAIVASSCEKDYPKDIPDWLIEKINYCDKRINNCHELIIDEYIYQGNLYYSLYKPNILPMRSDYYDYNGNYICADPWQNPNPTCFSNGNAIITRRIWQEN